MEQACPLCHLLFGTDIMIDIAKLQLRLIASCRDTNQLATCFDFNGSKPIARTVSSSASSNSILRCKALGAISNSSVTLHDSVVTFTYYHLQNLVGVKNNLTKRTIPHPFYRHLYCK